MCYLCRRLGYQGFLPTVVGFPEPCCVSAKHICFPFGGRGCATFRFGTLNFCGTQCSGISGKREGLRLLCVLEEPVFGQDRLAQVVAVGGADHAPG